ncbi:hypothetical protein LI90_3998 [Carbonactinospora thermoautotrophica]|uniref:Uncharacterized protein n=1 Tax=Carbonactinospora thermoautotrophica TaxID=1469144 RepID=A0A132MYJ5_9ACTN|nr:hypothetical protein LI90_3998 [Carbonactinospora thermoautotrophica]
MGPLHIRVDERTESDARDGRPGTARRSVRPPVPSLAGPARSRLSLSNTEC